MRVHLFRFTRQSENKTESANSCFGAAGNVKGTRVGVHAAVQNVHKSAIQGCRKYQNTSRENCVVALKLH
uniref:Uncharacterized protein n=1 Tax=Physcomitrium patens TaxID=3218 RepID=A0A2K1IFA8_PHYPA|nr:hypothetical protein PHYPA_028552 [Physcomitrium patens]